MGMYTALHLAIELRKDTPLEVIRTLEYMTGMRPETEAAPAHPLFQTGRWTHMLTSDSYYHSANAGNAFIYDDIAGTHFLTVLSSFKDYEDEITKFVDWISPHIYVHAPKWIGYSWYEEADEPTMLYRKVAA